MFIIIREKAINAHTGHIASPVKYKINYVKTTKNYEKKLVDS